MALRILSRLPPVQACVAYPVRHIYGKLNRVVYEKPAPFPEDKVDFGMTQVFRDPTSPRMDENSRVIVVDGAHAVGKTKLAKQLAEEFDMKLFEHPTVSDLYVNSYGVDLRKYAPYLSPIDQPYDEKDFARNPLGAVAGSGDRFIWRLMKERLLNYLEALQHLFNTGQGVVVEGNPYSNCVHYDAAYHQGWITRRTWKALIAASRVSLCWLLKPNVIVYLDSPVDKVIKNIEARGNEWDKDSPVWTNKQYLSEIYQEMKRHFLKEEQKHSYVLVYDWSEPGDVDVVVEDIEDLELDQLDIHTTNQSQWKDIRKEVEARKYREMYCSAEDRYNIMNEIECTREVNESEHLTYSFDDVQIRASVLSTEESEVYGPGFNPLMGDKGLFWKNPTPHDQVRRESRIYGREHLGPPFF